MFEFKHPKYYKELRSIRNNWLRSLAKRTSTEAPSVHPGPGLKRQATSVKLQAASSKRQAPSFSNNKLQASSSKQQASSSKPAGFSSMIREPRYK